LPVRQSAQSSRETYESWVELDERTREIQAEVESLVAVRQQALGLIERTQEVFDQAEAIQKEAQHTRDAVRTRLDRLVDVSPRAFAAGASTVRDIDETKKAQAMLQQGTEREAWEEVERAGLRATEEMLKALNAVGTAKAWVERELEEAKNLAAEAESLKQLAQKELSSAQAFVRELFLEGQIDPEASELAESLEVSSREGLTSPQLREQPLGPHLEAEARAQILPMPPGPGATSGSAGRGETGKASGPVPDSVEASEGLNEEVLKEELAELRRSLENIRLSRGVAKAPPSPIPPSPRPPGGGGKPKPPEAAHGPERDQVGPLPGQRPKQETHEAAFEAGPSGALPTTFSGRLCLIVTPCPDADMLVSFLEALDKVVGVAKVADARPLSGGAEFQFLLNLGEQVMEVEELKKAIPQAELVPLAEDRLSIRWSPK